jgi:sugar lactone lactonase YvrE
VANVCFGGPKLNRLFICGTTSLYSVFPEHARGGRAPDIGSESPHAAPGALANAAKDGRLDH